jgi:rod shape determining protein RodA
MYYVEKTKGQNFFRQFDFVLFASVLLLTGIGLLVLSSATESLNGGSRIMMMQIIGIVIGVILALIISSFDYKDFKSLGFILYAISIVLLLIVLFKGTGMELGSKSWLKIGGIVSFQPAELAKLTFVIVSSVFLERIKEGQKSLRSNVIKLGAYAAIPIALIVLQPDFGMTIVFIFMFFVMIFVCGLPGKYLASAFGALLVSAPILWFTVLNSERKNRILVFLDPNLDPKGSGYNVIQAKTAIGSGQLYGKGIYQGIQNQSGSVPVKESDFIFTVIGEELGFIGSVIIIALIFFIIIRCIYIAKNSRDSFGSFVVIGLAGMFTFQAFENIGMCIGLLPVTGLPLPFVSGGGTAMISNYIAIGIILSISMRRKKTIFNTSQ